MSVICDTQGYTKGAYKILVETIEEEEASW